MTTPGPANSAELITREAYVAALDALAKGLEVEAAKARVGEAELAAWWGGAASARWAALDELVAAADRAAPDVTLAWYEAWKAERGWTVQGGVTRRAPAPIPADASAPPGRAGKLGPGSSHARRPPAPAQADPGAQERLFQAPATGPRGRRKA